MPRSTGTPLIRRTPADRLLAVGGDAGAAAETTCTIAAHLYRGTYYPGSHPAVDKATRFQVRREKATLVFTLSLEEPDLKAVLEGLAEPARQAADFFTEEFVSLNFLDAEARVVQVGIKADGRAVLCREGQLQRAPRGLATVERKKRAWMATVRLPLRVLGLSAARFAAAGVAFDLVRHRAATAAITAWCPIPDDLPFVELYDFPVFCFGHLAERAPRRRPPSAAGRLGKVRYEGPRRVEAGAFLRAALVYEVGPAGLAPGGAVRFNLSNEVIECNRNSPSRRHLPEKDWSRLQWDRPADAGYVTASASRRGAGLALCRENVFAITARLTGNAALQPGDTVRIELGQDERGPGVRAQLLSQDDYAVKVSVDPVGNHIFHALPCAPHFDVGGRGAVRFAVHAPPTPRPGTAFRLLVVAIDAFGNVADRHTGRFQIHSPVQLKGLPKRPAFRRGDRGVAAFTVSTREEAVFVLTARDGKDAALSGTSNLIVTDGSFGPEPLYFGDIHTHSQLSDGRVHPVAKGREVGLHRGCDFWALTDHCHDKTPARLALWHEALRVHHSDGRFVTLPAYEWTCSMGQGRPWVRPMQGHRNVYFRRPVPAVPDGVSSRSNSVARLARALEEQGEEFFLITHFHCGDPTYLPAYEQGAEISGWAGDFIREEARGPGGTVRRESVQATFRHRQPVAVVAGSDHGTEAYYTGLPAELTGLRCSELTRDAVFAALRDGATYATTGQKTLLRFQVNGREPGDGKKPVRAKRRRLEVTVGSAMPVVQVQVIKNGKPLKNLGSFDFGVQSFHLVDTERTPQKGYYYLRVRTAQGHYAWSSPIFYEVP